MDLKMEILKLKREMFPRCVASQTLETHKKQLQAARHPRDLQRRGCGWNHVKMFSACNYSMGANVRASSPYVRMYSETQSVFEHRNASKP